MSLPIILPAVAFPERDLCRSVDARRWHGGERNTRRGPSPIHGFGAFAMRRIERGYPVLVREPLSGSFPVNHSETPNTARASNRAGLFALRDIERGEEITEDYRFLPYFDQALPNLPHLIRQAAPWEYEALLAREEFTHLGRGQ